ncbi:MAG: helicase, partial [Deltaproteobacteria bacterium]|nr:helicase [Deltaproteobacteria bacterium]
MRSLKDRLSNLTFRQAAKLLGERGERLLQQGGKYEIDLDEHVRLTEEQLTVRVGGSVALIAAAPDLPDELRLECTSCPSVCEHLGAALALVLEEKACLGLSAPAPERAPVESLTDEELVLLALEERRERARTERMTVSPADRAELWTDYAVTSGISGRTYRVALRGWERGESYCSCPDFRKNTLGTCKHVLHVLAKVPRRFPKA